MKVFFLFVLLFSIPLIFSQTTAIPDANFEQALIDLGYDNVLDGQVLTANVDTVLSLNVTNKGISNLLGIEDFSSLSVLYCDSNQLTTLNLSSNENLNWLFCNNNQLTSLHVNSPLQMLNCSYNELTNLNLSNYNAPFAYNLKFLDCSFNNLSVLDISHPDIKYFLRTLICNNNQLTELNLSEFQSLGGLNCGYNDLYCLHMGCANYEFMSVPQAFISNNPNLECVEVFDTECSYPWLTSWVTGYIVEWDSSLIWSFDNSCGFDCTSGLENLNATPKTLVKIVDLMGRETIFKANTHLIYVYDDGSTEKVYSAE